MLRGMRAILLEVFVGGLRVGLRVLCLAQYRVAGHREAQRMLRCRTSRTATPRTSPSAHKSTALAWIVYPYVNARSLIFAKAVCPESPRMPVCRFGKPKCQG